ncbi:Holliday junction branch migration protein RuvA [Polluticaenibacter yanchengensis]|uniref:Holliday junction branch migration complex subunit RuvA n=1 Tax=Polluticaenibacter yanchengensis TaxID=3014562 RepID=A0ABT4UNA1_9BACT|nr:Holliday junction branch migration protein RuvA [Chitinophagaceae bacterium LY-5]
MIVQLTGKFINLTPTKVVIDVNGVGYEVQISLNTYSAINGLESGMLYIHLRITEDAHMLFGFSTELEKEVFLKLISVSGVGSMTARMVLSSMKANEVQETIVSGNAKQLESVKGIGKKTAERVILELKDKMNIAVSTTGASGNAQQNVKASHNEAVEAMIALGITKSVAENAVKKACGDSVTPLKTEDIIKMAFRYI